MADDHRIEQGEQPLDYTCENARYKTNIGKGKKHGSHSSCGSVFEEPLAGVQGTGYSLWMEHVIEKKTQDDELYWLMWYKNGIPTIPLSGVFRKDDIGNMVRLLASFMP